MNGAAERPVVGLFGAFDTGEIGEMALRRVIESELGRRRPDIDLIALAPFGVEHPVPGDEGRPARPLPHGVGAGELDLDALILSGDVLGDDLSWAARYGVPVEAMSRPRRRRPGAQRARWLVGTRPPRQLVRGRSGRWRGGVSRLKGKDVWARNLATHERLGGTAAQSGDPVLLASRIFSPDVLRRRADLLRLCGAVPTGRRVVIEASARPLSPIRRASCRSGGGSSARRPEVRGCRRQPQPGETGVSRDTLPGAGGDRRARAHASGLGGARRHRGCHLRIGRRWWPPRRRERISRPQLGVPVLAIDPNASHRFDPVIPHVAGDVAYAVEALLGREAPGGDRGGDGDARRRLRRACGAAPARNGCDPDRYGARRRRLGAHHPSAAPCGRADSAAG